jgi:hypothetical protein
VTDPPGTDRGASSLLVVAAAGLAVVLAALVIDVGLLVAHRLRVAAAADAAALAAAPVTFRRFGAAADPRSEAAAIARQNDAVLVSCVCGINTSLATRSVRVVVAADIDLVFFGRQRVTAESAASYTPIRLGAMASGEPNPGRTTSPSIRAPPRKSARTDPAQR